MKKICFLICAFFTTLSFAHSEVPVSRPVYDLNWGSYLGDGHYVITQEQDPYYLEGSFVGHSKFEWGYLTSSYVMNDKAYIYGYRFSFSDANSFNVEVTAYGSSHQNDAAHEKDFVYNGEGFCMGQQCQLNIDLGNGGSLQETFTFTKTGLLKISSFKFRDASGVVVKKIIWTENLTRIHQDYNTEIAYPIEERR